MEECSKLGKRVIVLDRPNPAGRPVEGTLLENGFVSFVGAAEGLPMRHGLTLGEAGLWFKKRLKIDLEFDVVKMQGYDMAAAPGYGWPEGQISWVNPSPNAPTLSMARSSAGTVMLEGTHLSEGRGTTRPLEGFGAPDLDGLQILKAMEALAPGWLTGCMLGTVIGGRLMSYVFLGPRRVASMTIILWFTLRPPLDVSYAGSMKDTCGVEGGGG